MNNYRDYYNYVNNNYNQPVYTNNVNTGILDPYEGFVAGNMFPDLYNGYKINPVNLKPGNDQAKLLTYIDSLSFALNDINLYLDLNPDNGYAINLFNEYSRQKEAYLNEYQSKYGPLDMDSYVYGDSFTWIKSPWPWECGY